MRTLGAIPGKQPGFRAYLVQIFGNRHGVPYRYAVMFKAGHQDRGCEQQNFRARGRVVGRDQFLTERQA